VFYKCNIIREIILVLLSAGGRYVVANPPWQNLDEIFLMKIKMKHKISKSLYLSVKVFGTTVLIGDTEISKQIL